MYDNIDQETQNILASAIRPLVSINIPGCRHLSEPWMAIFASHLMKNNAIISLTYDKYYYKQETLDTNWPTNNKEDGKIADPFNEIRTFIPTYMIQFIDTTTGTKIYDYAQKLAEKHNSYDNKQNIAIALTESKQHRVKVIVNNNTAWVISNQITQDLVIKALSTFPILFDIEELKTPDILDFCKKVAKGETLPNLFTDFIKEIKEAEEEKAKDGLIKALNYKTEEILSKIATEIDDRKINNKNYLDAIDLNYRKIKELQATKLGIELQNKLTKEDLNGILEYIKNNKFISNFKIDYEYSRCPQLDFTVTVPITIYESEPLQRQMKNDRLDLNDKEKKVLNAFDKIFIKEEYKMYCEAHISLDLSENTIRARRTTNIHDYTKMWQPHLALYDCWGDNKGGIRDSLRAGDLVDAINRIIIAVRNINFTDSTVLRNWIENINGSNALRAIKTCLKDDEWYSIEDIIKEGENDL